MKKKDEEDEDERLEMVGGYCSKIHNPFWKQTGFMQRIRGLGFRA